MTSYQDLEETMSTNVSAYSRGMMGYQTPNIDRIANEGSLSGGLSYRTVQIQNALDQLNSLSASGN